MSRELTPPHPHHCAPYPRQPPPPCILGCTGQPHRATDTTGRMPPPSNGAGEPGLAPPAAPGVVLMDYCFSF